MFTLNINENNWYIFVIVSLIIAIYCIYKGYLNTMCSNCKSKDFEYSYKQLFKKSLKYRKCKNCGEEELID